MVTERRAPHLAVVATVAPGADRRQRFTVVALAVGAVGLFAAAYFVPWWEFTLFAPQYPRGLRLLVSLTGLSGDVREIDMLNHYIGMAHLENAAAFERAHAAWGVAAVGVAVIALAVLVGKRHGWLIVLPAVALLGGFIADSWFWLHRFGHHLNPHAPLHIPPFTPHFFGPGTIGQFRTVAVPQLGFVLALAGLALLVVAVLLRRRVCRACAKASSCDALCSGLLVGGRSR